MADALPAALVTLLLTNPQEVVRNLDRTATITNGLGTAFPVEEKRWANWGAIDLVTNNLRPTGVNRLEFGSLNAELHNADGKLTIGNPDGYWPDRNSFYRSEIALTITIDIELEVVTMIDFRGRMEEPRYINTGKRVAIGAEGWLAVAVRRTWTVADRIGGFTGFVGDGNSI